MPILEIIVFILGLLIVQTTLISAIRVVVLPRTAQTRLAQIVFIAARVLFALRIRWVKAYRDRDRIMAFYAPISLLCLPITWITMVLLGYMLMFWAIGFRPWYQAFLLSGSSLLTLGFAPVTDWLSTVLAFTEATLGLGLVALLITYLPTMYSAFSHRETAVSLLEVYTSSPASPIRMLERFHRIHGLEELTHIWRDWESWFAELEESHTSLTALVFFRSPSPERSWVTAAGAILDTAALRTSTLNLPRDPRAELCLRAGYLALRSIATGLGIRYEADPTPDSPISITRAEFDQVCERLAGQGIAIRPDRDQAWRDFAGWRVNYDTVLVALCDITMAPIAFWSSDRPLIYDRPWFVRLAGKAA